MSAIAVATLGGLTAALPARAVVGAAPTVQVLGVPAALLPAGSAAATDAALAPSADGAGEAFAVSSPGGPTVLLKATTDGQISETAGPPAGLGAASLVGMVNTDGLLWALSATALYAIAADGTATAFPGPSGGAFTDIALGLDGNLFVADHAGRIDRCVIDPSPSATCAVAFSYADSGLPANGPPLPDAIAAAGADLWFATDGLELASMTTDGQFTAYAARDDAVDASTGASLIGPVSADPHTLALGDDGKLYAIGSTPVDPTNLSAGLSGTPTAIVQIAVDTGHLQSDPGALQRWFTAGLAADAQLTSLTTGPDGNLWFTEERSGGVGEVGSLDPRTGAITSYPLPAGTALAGAGADVIAAGPAASNTVWFAAQSGGAPAIGVVSGLGSPASAAATTTTSTSVSDAGPGATSLASPRAGTLAVARRVELRRPPELDVPIFCAGVAASRCSGDLSLEASVSSVTVVGRGKHQRRVRVRRILDLGTTNYAVGAGSESTVAFTLLADAVSAITGAPRQTLRVSASVSPVAGATTTTNVSVSLAAPGPARRRPSRPTAAPKHRSRP